jgi:hypothetical protein
VKPLIIESTERESRGDDSLHGVAIPQQPPEEDEHQDGRETPAAKFLRAVAGDQTSQKLAHDGGG